MRDDDGRKLDHRTLELLRIRAVRQIEQGAHPEDVAARVGATIYFTDEAGVRSDDHAGTTWAPVGQTPVVATTGDRFGINLISAVARQGRAAVCRL